MARLGGKRVVCKPVLVQDVRQRTGPMRGISQLHLPMRRPEDVIPYLGSPGQWKDDRSAKLVAESWFAAKDHPELHGLPEMVRVTLGRCPPDQVSRFAEAELVDAFLERCIELGDGSTPSQTDVLAILRLPDEIAIMMVHSFDPHDPGFEDFARFSVAMGMPKAVATRIVRPVSREGVDLHLGWTADRPSNEGYVVMDGRKTDAGFFDNH